MDGFTTIRSRVVPVLVDHIDTDQIIPARFLKTTAKAGLGAVLFCDWRYLDEVPDLAKAADARPRPDFALNHPELAGAHILLAGDNFGCGSSREHAPWALVDWGFRAVISTSFADIFRSNALKNSLLPVEVEPALHEEIVQLAKAEGGLVVTIDLPSRLLHLPGDRAVHFPVDAFSRRCLIEGIDQLGYLLGHAKLVEKYEQDRGVGLRPGAKAGESI
jgi:3-isopropylmalate/(R)-2-methylmalate dehydratase small subunit